MVTAPWVPDVDRMATLAFALFFSDGPWQIEDKNETVVVERALVGSYKHDVHESQASLDLDKVQYGAMLRYCV